MLKDEYVLLIHYSKHVFIELVQNKVETENIREESGYKNWSKEIDGWMAGYKYVGVGYWIHRNQEGRSE